jgi:hypothetical protein
MAYQVDGARAAKALGLRTVLRSRNTFGGVAGAQPAAGAYYGLWLRDFCMFSRVHPGYWTAARVRAVVDAFVATIGGDATGAWLPAEQITTAGVSSYRPGGSPGTFGYYPTFDSAAYLARLLCQAYDLGDATVFGTHKAAVKAALDGTPRSGSLVYANPALTDGSGRPTIGWGFEDCIRLSGGLGMASALYACAYLDLAAVATASGDASYASACTTAANTLITGLASLRRVDGLYNAATSDLKPHAILSSLMVSRSLVTGTDRTATAAAIYSAFNAGNITQLGAVRHLVAPNYFTSYEVPNANHDVYQNGAYWLGEWVTWLCDALVASGHSTTALAEIQAATDEVIRQHGIDAVAPWEWQNGGTRGVTLYGAAAGFLADTVDSLPPSITATLSGAWTQDVPAGFVLEWGGTTGAVEGDGFSTSGTVALRDDTGAAVSTSSGSVGPVWSLSTTTTTTTAAATTTTTTTAATTTTTAAPTTTTTPAPTTTTTTGPAYDTESVSGSFLPTSSQVLAWLRYDPVNRNGYRVSFTHDSFLHQGVIYVARLSGGVEVETVGGSGWFAATSAISINVTVSVSGPTISVGWSEPTDFYSGSFTAPGSAFASGMSAWGPTAPTIPVVFIGGKGFALTDGGPFVFITKSGQVVELGEGDPATAVVLVATSRGLKGIA